MFGLGPTELVIIAVIVLLIFGAKRLPEIGKGIGGAIREFREVKKDLGSHKKADKSLEAKEEVAGKDEQSSLESKVVDKVLEQVPGVKKAMDVKKKADKVKKFIQ